MAPRRSRSGFSLIEAVIAALILGLALAAITNAQLSSMRGLENSQEGLQARALASAIADDLALVSRDLTGTVDTFGCLDGFGGYNNIQGCALPDGSGYSAEYGCTYYFTEETLPNLSTTGLDMTPLSGLLIQQGAITDPGGGFRVDVITNTHPDASIPGGRTRVLDVFVCYTDPYNPGHIREIRETRLLFAERSNI